MTVTPVEFIADGGAVMELTGLRTNEVSGSFASWFTQEINSVSHLIQDAEIQIQRLTVGDQDNLHQIMLSLGKAQLALELTVQVRNRLLEGYQEIMRMQV